MTDNVFSKKAFVHTDVNISDMIEDMKIYTKKLPDGYLKRNVQHVLNLDITYIASLLTKSEYPIYGSVSLKNDKINKVLLIISDLNIDIDTKEKTASCDRIDDCIYTIYLVLNEMGMYLNKNILINDDEFHKLLITYLSVLFSKTLNVKDMIITNKNFTKIITFCCAYLYFRHYFKMKQTEAYAKTLKILKKSNTLDSDIINNTIDPLYSTFSKYDNIKNIGAMFIDFKLTTNNNPNATILNLMSKVSKGFIYRLFSDVYHFAAYLVLNNYPTGFDDKKVDFSSELTNSFEKHINDNYIKLLKFEPSKK